MKKNNEFKLDDLVTLIDPQAAQELAAANGEIDWPVPVISQYGQRVHCWNSQRREFTITLSATEIRKVN
ncbi:hypothetical protein [Spirosoma endbachense]|uniref:Uncharacterized protein n=1 Tax=Spirosoma endbachense TaxID=2666025 RepID=A0A6P1W7Y0_9BACT|nr:hypothetical protein [Spirosoma endbachense]QHW01015.1 hypothetical protein GJR95_40955 [Spirosoma endbachense]